MSDSSAEPGTRTVVFLHGSGELAGMERVFRILLGALDPCRYRPVVLATAHGPFIDELEQSVPVRRLSPVARLRRPWQLRRTLREVGAAVGALDPAVVVGNGEKMAVIAGAASRRAPVLAWLHDAAAGWDRPGALATQIALRTSRPAAVVCCAEWLAVEMRARRGLPATWIHNGLDLGAIPDGGAGRVQVLAASGSAPDDVVVGFFGRLQRWKAPDLFLRAMARASTGSNTDPRARLGAVVVGGALFGREEEFAAELPGLASGLGLEGGVRLLGHRADALELMSGVDIVVHCSRRPDPLPTVVMEAMAMGRAVVATRTKGPEELIDNEVDGLLVPPDDEVALAGAISRLARSADLRHRLGDAARQRALGRTAADMAARFAAVFDSLAA